MEKKYQIYLAAFLMYVVAGFAGFIYLASNYWVVAIITGLAALFMVACLLGIDAETKNSTRIQWISTFAFVVAQLALTICIEIIKLPFVGVFKYINYGVQILGVLFIMYLVVYLTINYTRIDKTIVELIKNRKAEKTEILESTETNEVATQVEEVINQEEPVSEEEFSMEDIEIVGEPEEQEEPEVLGIEFKEEDEIATPYMEEEL